MRPSPATLRRLGLGLLVATIAATGCSPEPVAPRATSLVVVVIDTLRQDRVGAYGSTRGLTPVIDRLAAAGARADGIAPSSWTKPAVATLLTGLHPIRHQVMGKTDLLPASVAMLAERLRAGGFATAALSTNAHVAPAWGFDRGFDRFVSYWRETGERFPSSEQVNERIRPLLDGLAPPFFLYVHYLDPHQPYAPRTLAGGAELPEPLARLRPLRLAAGTPRPGREVPAELLAAAGELYDAEVWESDAALGVLMDELAKRRLDTGLLTVVVSDHGEEFLEHGRLGHGFDLYEETIRVPLVLHAPGVVPAGLSIGEMGLEDVVPTVLELLGRGGDGLEDLDGRSVVPELTAGAGGDREPAPRLLHLDGTESPTLALRAPGWKLVVGAEPYAKELFDLEHDPAERSNLLRDGDAPAPFPRLARELADRYGRLAASAPERRRGSADAELLDQLVALGYLDLKRSGDDRRVFPRQLRPADPLVGGLRGWEDIARFTDCFEAENAPTGQLLMGWSPPIPGEPGAWAHARASFAWPVAPDDTRRRAPIVLTGHHWGGAPMTLTVRLDGAVALERRLAPGPVRLEIPPPVEARPLFEVHVVRFEGSPPLRPRDSGSDDPRELSIFVERICRGEAPAQRK